MDRKLLALILGQLCVQTRATLFIERYKLGLITIDQLGEFLLSTYEATSTNLDIATKLLNTEDN